MGVRMDDTGLGAAWHLAMIEARTRVDIITAALLTGGRCRVASDSAAVWLHEMMVPTRRAGDSRPDGQDHRLPLPKMV